MRLRMVAVAAATLALTACAIPVPETPAAPTLENQGALLESQSSAVVSQTFTELAAADDASDATAFGVRVGGDARLARAAEYVVKAAGGDAPAKIPTQLQAVYSTDQETWPRVFAGVTEAPSDSLTPVVLVWVQDDVTQPYQMRYWAHMLPAAVLPAMPVQATGTDMLSLDANGLTMTPSAAIELYTTILNDGTKGERAHEFAPDAYRERMFAARDELLGTAKKRGGDYTDKITARTDEAFVLRTGEGGALVFVPMTVTSTFKVAGAQLTLPKKDKALLSGKLKDQVVHNYSDYIVISVPPEGSLELPAVVAADHHLLTVSTKASPPAGGDASKEGE